MKTEMYRRSFCRFFCLAGPTFSACGHTPTGGRIVLGTALDIRESAYGRRLVLLYGVAFKRLCLELVVIDLVSPRRLSFEADSGRIDGELTRSAEYGQSHPNLVRVEPPHEPLLFAAYSLDPNIRFDGWDELAGTDLRVGYRAGLLLSEKRLHAVMAPWRTVGVASVKIGLKMLQAKRFDLFVDTEPSVDYELTQKTQNGPTSAPLVYRAGTMELTAQHLYLHMKHKNLAVELARELQSLRKLPPEQLNASSHSRLRLTEPN